MPPRRKTAPRSSPTGSEASAALRDASRGIRLQKALAEAGVASRRACEQLIESGRVRVNGQRVTELPAWVDPGQDTIEVDGEAIARPSRKGRRGTRHTYLMLHKPRNVISTNRDPEGRRRVIDLIPSTALPGRPRLFPVGRLDADSTGLLLLTDDGELTHRLTHPRYEVAKHYLVSIKGRVGEDDLERLRRGIYLAPPRDAPPGRKPPAKSRHPQAKRASVERVRIVRHETDRTRGDRTTLAITLREGQNREIRRLLARLGFKVRRLKRVGIGPLRLKGLAVGQWRPLTSTELSQLRKAAGMGGRHESSRRD